MEGGDDGVWRLLRGSPGGAGTAFTAKCVTARTLVSVEVEVEGVLR